jgi:CRP/FNR family transcriptional regulator
MDKNKIYDFLKNTDLFQSLLDREIETVIDKMIVKNYRKNETILLEADTNKYMYIILSGRVKAVRMNEDGNEIILAIHESGHFFGEMSLIDGKTTPASVIALADSLIAIISDSDFYSILFAQQKVVRNLLEILSARLRNSWDTIQLLNFKNASQRAIMLFVMLSEEYGKRTPDGIVLNIRLTHQDISDMTGLTRETVTRVIDRLQKSGEISITKDKFIRLSPKIMESGIKIN